MFPGLLRCSLAGASGGAAPGLETIVPQKQQLLFSGIGERIGEMSTVCKQNSKPGYMKRFGSRSLKKIEQVRRVERRRMEKLGIKKA